MEIKEVKNYSGRLRINITSKDGFQPNEEVALLTLQEFEEIKDSVLKLRQEITILENENDILKKTLDEQEAKVKDIVNIALEPITVQYESELQKRDAIIESKDKEINGIKAILNKFTTSISGLSLWDFIRGRHKSLINDFHDSIWVKVPTDRVTDVEKIPNTDD